MSLPDARTYRRLYRAARMTNDALHKAVQRAGGETEWQAVCAAELARRRGEGDES